MWQLRPIESCFKVKVQLHACTGLHSSGWDSLHSLAVPAYFPDTPFSVIFPTGACGGPGDETSHIIQVYLPD